METKFSEFINSVKAKAIIYFDNSGLSDINDLNLFNDLRLKIKF